MWTASLLALLGCGGSSDPTGSPAGAPTGPTTSAPGCIPVVTDAANADGVNGVDDDCDGSIDEDWAFVDDDGDGWTDVEGDCDDADPAFHPGADDPPSDGVDTDCDNLDVPATSVAGLGVAWSPTTLLRFVKTAASLGTGDFDGDGRDDLLIGTPGDWYSSLGGAFAAYGATSLAEMVDDPPWILYFEEAGFQIDAGFDASGDGLDDALLTQGLWVGAPEAWVVGHPLFDGMTSEDAFAHIEGYETFQAPVVSEDLFTALLWPDLDGDGVAELVLGSRTSSPNDAIDLKYSPHSGTFDRSDAELVTEIPYCAGSWLVRTADLDADGSLEVISPDCPDYGDRPKMVLVDGIGGAGSWTTPWDGPGGTRPLASADWTGDGYGDLVAGSHMLDVDGDRHVGVAWLAAGPPPDTGPDPLEDAGLVFPGAAPLDWCGFAAAAADLDGDGQDDLLIGCPGDYYEAWLPGRVHLYYGPVTTGRAAEDADLILVGDEWGSMFGQALTSGDYDGDGANDLVIGAPASTAGGLENGRVYLLSGADLAAP